MMNIVKREKKRFDTTERRMNLAIKIAYAIIPSLTVRNQKNRCIP